MLTARSSRRRALTREVCSGSAAARAHGPESHGAPTQEGLGSFGTTVQRSAGQLTSARGSGRASLKSVADSAPTSPGATAGC